MEGDNISYNIISCTSECDQYPISSIQNASIRSNGWLSQQNPQFPVQIVIDLGSEYDVKKIQFVSHQSKISNHVDISYGSSPGMLKPLGSFQFSNNSHTNFTARELKSINLTKVRGRYFRISIRGCHPNASNPFSQVGLVSLKILGSGGAGEPAAGSRSDNKVAYNININELINKLEIQKADAVSVEDFDLANKLKIQLIQLKSKKSLLEDLEIRKKEAVEKEDYEAARDIKAQIESILSGDDPAIVADSGRSSYTSRPSSSTLESKRESIPQQRQYSQTTNEDPSLLLQKYKSSDLDNRENEEEDIYQASSRVASVDDRPIRPKVDDDTNSRFSEADNSLTGEPDELSHANKQESQILIAKFGEDPVARFFSKSWQLRLEGIQMLGQMISQLNPESGNDAFICYCKILRYHVNDIQKAIITEMLKWVTRCAENLKISPRELSSALSPIFTQLCNKIGGSNQQISDAVCNFLIFMSRNRCNDLVLSFLLSENKKTSAWKVTRAKITTLHNIILDGFIDTTSILSQIMQLTVSALESPKKEVRSAATELVLTMEMIHSSDILKYLESLPKMTKSEVESAIEERKKMED